MSTRRLIIDYEYLGTSLFDLVCELLELREEMGLVGEWDASETPKNDALLVGEQVDQ